MHYEIAPQEDWLDPLLYRFGFSPNTFDEYTVFRPNRKYLCIVANDHEPRLDSPPMSTGIVFLRTQMAFPKLTTAAAMIFGDEATRNVMIVNRTRADMYLSRQSFQVSAKEVEDFFSGPGYVILRFNDITLGLALFRLSKDGTGIIESLFPKTWSIKNTCK